MRGANNTRIVDYDARYGDAFKRLNVEWLEKYFLVEPIDEEVLADPQNSILASGGVILYALAGDEVAGTVALKHQGDKVYELTKMAVTERFQGLGLGRQLLCAAVDRFGELKGESLYLESHSSLGPALTLYESAGFHHQLRPKPSDYERSDVYMVYRPDR
ncbi:MAG: GNAT family N-acetyltransferase [Gammaproteobacteria bacterium]|nr:GNAT family N-acetyltransferase [Gammaproteobacteria bacterium]